MKQFIKIMLFLFSFTSLAGESGWETIKIPGAKCGDSSDYRVFIKKGSPTKLAVELMGGGACWDLASCWGPNLRTWIHPIPKLPVFSYLTSDETPLKDHTFVYITYCNGDVYAGNHSAEYMPFKSTHHEGFKNIKLTVDHLQSSGLVSFKKADSLVLYGSSAGGIGSLIHKDIFDTVMRRSAQKVLIADSVGLHFGNKFWKKFPSEMINDFKTAFSPSGIEVDENDGLVAPQLKKYCKLAKGWKVGFIQKTKDIIMSTIFGDISQDDHRVLVLGPKGIRKVLKNSPNCETHISEGNGHALLLLPFVARDSLDMDSGESAKDFADRLIRESGI